MVDIRRAQPLDAAVRHQYSGPTFGEGFLALAILVESSPFGRMMGNISLRVAHPGIPTQLFVDETRAMKWLIGYRR